ncbi:MAG: GNAT family N-acetyltransferase [Staphylococcus equorum]|uniref:GNAT family N-acetyltransferase n=1 Tax=Staphylococcus TaxID=1279 RepID=UPI002554C70B|nr:GNAT family N-acetyltransferase [Staphylococcus equorum]MDK9872033.1 GNAT family N-acetyltransferase [Staphylococcus equorum]MDK9876858.1 GNAT family N-acetyltransferase [Staphylococcus equorum]MDN5830216.1 GNAT family N-acetyltransferase [Staphylococcus equorum]MDN6572630.1 GNAT family N-acetyltransferase [Staphylococcus equorum]MDN6849834.1 GNAT family N-acetyltransferase [Staphylococcus equorum]
MELVVKRTKDLSNIELLHILEERIKVFVVEQKCAYQEIDKDDEEALHIMLKDENHIAAYTRIVDGQSHISFGRVLVAQNYRMRGYGRNIVQKTIDIINEKYSGSLISISGQAYLKSFYESFGFKGVSDIYLEDNIPHITFEMIAR